jgi:sugar phosphate isomerase/epimerase
MLIKEFGIQLYSVRHEIEQMGFAAVLEKLAAVGYTGVEFAGYGGLEAAEMFSLLQKYGLKAFGAHIGLDRLEQAFDEEIAYHKVLGSEFIVIPSAPFGNAEEVRQTAARLSKLTSKVKDRGFRFAFHNHGVEFERDGDRTRIENMMELASEVEVQLDVFWSHSMGADSEAFIKKHAGRVTSLHIKQIGASGESVDLGDGVIDFKALIQTGLNNGVGCFIHEQEEFSGDPFEGLENGYKHIMNLA